MTRNSLRRTLTFTGFLLAGLSGSAASQSLQRLSLQGSGAALFPTTEDPNFESETRLGYEVQARYTFSRFSIGAGYQRSEEHTSELQSQSNLVCRLLLEKKKTRIRHTIYHRQHEILVVFVVMP